MHLSYIANKQGRLRGYLQDDHADGATSDDDDDGTILPASLAGSPRDMIERTANTLTAERIIGPHSWAPFFYQA